MYGDLSKVDGVSSNLARGHFLGAKVDHLVPNFSFVLLFFSVRNVGVAGVRFLLAHGIVPLLSAWYNVAACLVVL